MLYHLLFISFSAFKRILLMLSNDACQYFLESQKPKIWEKLTLSPPPEVNTFGLFCQQTCRSYQRMECFYQIQKKSVKNCDFYSRLQMQTVLHKVLIENRSKPFLGIRTNAHCIVPGPYHHEAHTNNSFSQ